MLNLPVIEQHTLRMYQCQCTWWAIITSLFKQIPSDFFCWICTFNVWGIDHCFQDPGNGKLAKIQFSNFANFPRVSFVASFLFRSGSQWQENHYPLILLLLSSTKLTLPFLKGCHKAFLSIFSKIIFSNLCFTMKNAQHFVCFDEDVLIKFKGTMQRLIPTFQPSLPKHYNYKGLKF